MALKVFDGFDHYNNQGDVESRAPGNPIVWECHDFGATISFGLGRVGGKALHYQYLKGTLPAGLPALTIGCPHIIQSIFASVKGIGFYDTSTGPLLHQFSISLNKSNGSITIYDQSGSAVITSPANVFNPSIWQDIEVSGLVSSTVGFVVVTVNGVGVVGATGINTKNSGAAASVNTIWFGARGPFQIVAPILDATVWAIDDFYCCDNTVGPGTFPCNTFLGDMVVDTVFATSNGTVQWTPLAGTNWQEISEIIFDSDTTYNSSSTAGQADVFNFGTIDTSLPAVLGVQVTGAYRQSAAGSDTVNQEIISAGVTAVLGSPLTLASSYEWKTDLAIADPATGATWQAPAVNAIQAGYELAAGSVQARVSQIVVEVLRPNFVGGGGVPAIFPSTLIGQTPTVIKRPIGSTGHSEAGSGGEVRIGYWSVNKWEWELNYDSLPDGWRNISPSDLKTLMGFFVKQIADFGAFLFDDQDDDSVTGQFIGTGDGTSTTWTIFRYFNADATNPPEAVGYVNVAKPLNVYVNGVLYATSAYTIVTTTPGNQQIVFSAVPPLGQLITMDFSFYFLAAFKDPQQDFEKFMDKLWQVSKLTLKSLRN